MSARGNSLVLGSDQSGKDVVLSPEQRSMHLFACGATGSGKSKALESWIRQDLLQWPKTRCGMLCLDPDGKLYDDIMRFIAANDLRHLPVIPIDLRRGDFTISYNPLRKRSGTSSPVVVASVVDAIQHSFNQADSTATPRLAKWLFATFTLLHSEGLTLIDALRIISDPELRRAMVRRVEDVVARSIWQSALYLKESEFQLEVDSMMNRLRRFLSTYVMRAALCQPDISLDFLDVITNGSIVLVSLPTAKGQISTEDAATYGSLLCSDIWSAAQTRGKRDDLRPFYVYLDEFQKFVTPSMAESLDRARGYALSFTFACQFPSQLELRGESGKRVYHSVMANARTKVCFQLNHPDDLETMTLSLFRQQIDPNAVKSAIYSTKVVDHEIEYLRSYGQTTAQTHGTTDAWSTTDVETNGTSSQWSHTDGINDGVTMGSSVSDGISDSDTNGAAETTGLSSSTGGSITESNGDAVTNGTGHSHTTAVSYQLGNLDEDTRTGLTDGSCNPHNLPGDGEKMGDRARGMVVAESRGDAESESVIKSSSRAIAKNHSEGKNSSRSRSIAKQRGRSHGASQSAGFSKGASASDTFGGSETHSIAHGTTYGGSQSESIGISHSESWSPMLMPIMGKELSSLQFWSIEEQIFLRSQLIDALPARHCFVRVVDSLSPVMLQTLNVKEPLIMPSWVEYWTKRALKKLPFALPLSVALQRVIERHRSFDIKLLGYTPRDGDEPGSTRCPIV